MAEAKINSIGFDNDTLTILGENFGDSSNTPIRWKTFQDKNLLSGGWNIFGSLENEWKLIEETGEVYAHRFYYARRPAGLQFKFDQNHQQVYVSFLIKTNMSIKAGKFFRIYFDEGNIWLASGDTNLKIRGAAEIVETTLTQWSSPDNLSPEWKRIELFFDAGTKQVVCQLDGQHQWTNSWIGASFHVKNHTLDIGHMVNSGSEFFFDDIYVSSTAHRIEIVDTPEFDNATKRTIQGDILEWTPTRIILKPNFRDFKDIDKYLFIGSGSEWGTGFKVEDVVTPPVVIPPPVIPPSDPDPILDPSPDPDTDPIPYYIPDVEMEKIADIIIDRIVEKLSAK